MVAKWRSYWSKVVVINSDDNQGDRNGNVK
jgi:hypothetical protein